MIKITYKESEEFCKVLDVCLFIEEKKSSTFNNYLIFCEKAKEVPQKEIFELIESLDKGIDLKEVNDQILGWINLLPTKPFLIFSNPFL